MLKCNLIAMRVQLSGDDFIRQALPTTATHSLNCVGGLLGHSYYIRLMYPYCGTGLESRFLGAAFNNSEDLCSIRQISQFRTFKMIVHDYHNMQHHMAMPCGHTPDHTHINRLQRSKIDH